MIDTLFGAENVASQPARCSIVVTILAAGIPRFTGGVMANQLLTGDRSLTRGEPLELLFADFAGEAPAVRELSVPDAANLIAFRVVVLTRVLEFLGVVAARLARAQGFGDREHQPLLDVQPEYVKRGGYLTASCKAKLKELDLHWHELRHECASRWLEEGLDVREIQLLLGHVKLEITQRYLNITDVGELWGRRRAGKRAQA